MQVWLSGNGEIRGLYIPPEIIILISSMVIADNKFNLQIPHRAICASYDTPHQVTEASIKKIQYLLDAECYYHDLEDKNYDLSSIKNQNKCSSIALTSTSGSSSDSENSESVSSWM